MNRASISTAALAAIVIVIVVVAVAGGLAYYYISMRHVTTTSPTTTTSVTTTSTTMTTMTTTTTPPPTNTSVITLTVVTYSGSPVKLLNTIVVPLFEQEHPGVKVQVLSYPFTSYLEKEMTVLEAGSSQYDIVTYTQGPGPNILPYLSPLNESAFNISNLIMTVMNFGGVYYNPQTGQTTLYGIAPWASVLVMWYNIRFFDNATLQQEFYNEYHFSLNPWTWQNWTQVLDVDQFFTSHNITKYGILIYDDPAYDLNEAFPLVFEWYYMHNSTLNCGNPAGLPGYMTLFMGCYPKGWPYSFPPPSFNNSVGVEALEMYKELVSYEPNPSVLTVSFDNTPSLLASEQAPAGFTYMSQMAWLTPQNRTMFRFAPAPGGYAGAGATYFAISKYSQHKDLAMQLLELIVSTQVQVQSFYTLGLFPINKQAYSILLANKSMPSYMLQLLNESYYLVQHAFAGNPTIFTSLAGTWTSEFDSYIFDYLTGQISNPMQALQEAAQATVSLLAASTTSSSTTASSAPASPQQALPEVLQLLEMAPLTFRTFP
ncbi:MAG: ABC transporter substrate-binding protein [Acidilobus sp.]|nr:ABC transporter substrate-binding protein [Acidilobus sp.]